jgi:hypothetical protein
MAQRIATDAPEQKLLHDVAEFGWHCIKIMEDDGRPSWAFSIGLYETWGHPELVLFGLNGDTAHRIMGIVAEGLAKGNRPTLSAPTEDLLCGYACHYVRVPQNQYAEHVGFALWYYEGANFPLYQIVWPSKEGLFPWDVQATASFRQLQPVLGPQPIGT